MMDSEKFTWLYGSGLFTREIDFIIEESNVENFSDLVKLRRTIAIMARYMPPDAQIEIAALFDYTPFKEEK